MAHNSYNPHRERARANQTTKYEPKPDNPFIVVIQLAAIFLTLRVAMIIGGLPIFNIPYLDLWIRIGLAKFK